MQTDIAMVAPYFAISVGLLVVAALLARFSPFYATVIDEEERASRFHAIDGLRGFLALGVFFHHAVIGWFFYQHGRWEEPPSNFYTFLGQAGVGLFFMITAFLFWTKGLASGRRLDMVGLIESRIRRLAPMYLASVVCVWAVALALTGFQLQAPWALPRQMLEWLSFGLIKPGAINGFAQASLINANVQWSLAYEWLFYLFLPLGLAFARGWRFVFAAALAAAFIWKFSWRPVEWNFLFGALAAVLCEHKRIGALGVWRSRTMSCLALACLTVLASLFDSSYGAAQALLLFIVFFCVAQGNDLFGLLSTRAARLLGMTSYSIYLMHAIVLFVALRIADHVQGVMRVEASAYWSFMALCGLVVVGLSAATFRYIEHPFLRRGAGAGARPPLPSAASTLSALESRPAPLGRR